jgi:PAS domain S-box-containing protein
MDFNIKDILKLEYIGPFSSAILVLYGLWRKVIRPVSIVIKEDIEERVRRQEKQDQMMVDVTWIIEQLKPNGGSSLKDALNRVEADIHTIGQRQRLFMLDASEAIFETDAKGDNVYANRTYCKWLGKSYSDVLGRGWINSLHESTRARVVEEWFHAIEDKREFTLDYNMKDEHGDPFKVHCTATPMYDRNKNVSGWSGIVVKA